MPQTSEATCNEEKLAKLGTKIVGELRALEVAKLEGEFGRYGVRLYEPARGIDENQVVPDRPTKSISKKTFCWQKPNR